ncbi:MFS general substrate transporter [Xylariaceae sp. FL0662B]|nr:MFS general substrate transporter [Xylariaceae sp. FL0662B]
MKPLPPVFISAEKELPPPFGIKLDKERPPRPITKDPYRPMTASTKRLSFSSTEAKRPVKYGTGKFAGVELSPQPSNDPEDPLNWPRWKKHLNLVALLYMVALVGAMKTAFISVNSAVVMDEDVSYTSAVTLTAAPLMISAVSGMLSLIIARIWGKRPVYLASMVMIFIAVVWNTSVMDSFAQNMTARVFQALGWGAFDTLVLGSIQDTYFEHERQNKIALHYIVSFTTTWGSPLLGGVASAGPMGFATQFRIMSIFLAISILLLVFGAPETTFDRSFSRTQTLLAQQSQALWPTMTFTKTAVIEYLSTLKPWPYRVDVVDFSLILQAPRAILAPTSGLLFVLTFLPYAGLWSLASSLSLLFSPFPFLLSESSIGALMLGPFILVTVVGVPLAFPWFQKRFQIYVHLTTLAIGSALASFGILGFGLYLHGTMEVSEDDPMTPFNALSALGSLGERVSFPIVSFLLGLLAAGSLGLDATLRPVIQRSTAFTSANLAVCMRNTADMHGSLTCMRNFVAGAFVLGLPGTVFTWDGLKEATLGMGVAHIIITSVVCAIYWRWDENVRRLDGQVMRLVDLSILKESVSFFDTK